MPRCGDPGCENCGPRCSLCGKLKIDCCCVDDTLTDAAEELRTLEWSARVDDGFNFTIPACPRCYNPEKLGHKDNCTLSTIIERLKKLGHW